MKTKMAYFTLLLCFGLISQLEADVTTLLLPGHKATEGDLKTSDVVIAKFISFGVIEIDNAGALSYEQDDIQIIRALRGQLSGKLKVSFEILTFPGKDRETLPVLGTEYVMFIKKLGASDFEIIKLLKATDDNIAKIKTLTTSQATH
jgi:hypothetical protein